MKETHLNSYEIGQLISLETSLDPDKLADLLYFPHHESYPPLVVYESSETGERFCCNGSHRGVIDIHQHKPNHVYIIENMEDITESLGDTCLTIGIKNLEELEERIEERTPFKDSLYTLYARYRNFFERNS